MESDGYILLNRNLRRSPIWVRPEGGAESFDRRSAFIDLLFRAAFLPHKVEFSHRTVSLARGQLVTSGPVLAKSWGWSEKKVRNWLAKWEKQGAIRTIKKTSAGTLLEVVNYNFYQDPTNGGRAKSRASDEPTPSLRRASAEREKEGKELNELNKENKNMDEGSCGWVAGNSNGKRCTLRKLSTSIYCAWHDYNAAGGSPPRAPDDRELFDKWLLLLDDDHGWRRCDPEEIWRRAQGNAA